MAMKIFTLSFLDRVEFQTFDSFLNSDVALPNLIVILGFCLQSVDTLAPRYIVEPSKVWGTFVLSRN